MSLALKEAPAVQASKGHLQGEGTPPASLRRADWRFLLPLPDGDLGRLALIGGPPGLGARLLEEGLALQVVYHLGEGPQADVVAVLDGASLRLEEIAASLAPGGLLYIEVDRRRWGGLALSPGRLKTRLERSGFRVCGQYWAAPDLEHCRRYIPLDRPQAFAWYLSTLFVAGTPLLRLAELSARLFHRLLGLAPLVPCYALVAVCGGEAPPLASVLAHPEFPEAARGQEPRPLLLTSGQDDGSRAVLLPFSPGDWSPAAVVKIASLRALNGNTTREGENLDEVRACLKPSLAGSLPQSLGSFAYGDLSVRVESCMEGASMVVSSGRWRAPLSAQAADLRQTVSWLIDFQRQTQASVATWNGRLIERWVEAPLEAYAATFGLTVEEGRLFEAAVQRAYRLSGARLPLVRMHYDFGPWNIYRSGECISVIDWEFGRDWQRLRFGPGLYDLLYLVIYWSFLAGRAGGLQAEQRILQRLFLSPENTEGYAGPAREAIHTHLAAFDLPAGFVPLMLVHLWVEQALHQVERKRRLGTAQSEALKENPRLGNRPAQTLAALAAHSQKLFQNSLWPLR